MAEKTASDHHYHVQVHCNNWPIGATAIFAVPIVIQLGITEVPVISLCAISGLSMANNLVAFNRCFHCSVRQGTFTYRDPKC